MDQDNNNNNDNNNDNNNIKNILPLNIRIGIDQKLFFFDQSAPGCAFWLPNGTIIYNKLMNFIRNEYFKWGFDEVKTPIIAKKSLWDVSGHWEKYKENMFCFNRDDTEYALASMNCPKHCKMFGHCARSYRELPLRFADFGVLHRNEPSGSLTSLFRNISFCQDDAHVFCTYQQIKSEMQNALEFLTYVYSKFGFQFEVGLSTRPDEFIGEIEVWDKAEKELTDVLNESGLDWYEKQKDGAFYGPKIDIHLTDSLNRKHQCATIQLDFQLPSKERFDLKYVDENGESKTPVIIHRAIYGSFERFIAILCEHYNKKWPLWLNPKQIAILPISEKFLSYANQVKDELRKHKFYVDVDESDNTIPKKIRNAQDSQYNYILVVGQKEIDTKTVNVRYRDNDTKKMINVNDLIVELNNNISEFK